MAEIDNQQFRNTMGQFCTGVVVASACLNDEPVGFAAQSFVSLSLDPPLVALCPAKTSTSWPKIRESGSFCINILGSDQQSVCDAFARSGGNKFEGLGWTAGVTGSPVLEGVLAYVDCSLEAEHDAGDHTIAVGRVQALEVLSSGTPLLFFKGGYGSFEPITA
ncbi:MAG: flavin reductase [Gammaproteobacteria bacterium]|jgi:flavin reductase (DIM6/NTAB) family NADH-FMN oxidoreductase RutF|nr:MAG: flavin reductase [Gammaproteobacteria bacterium]